MTVEGAWATVRIELGKSVRFAGTVIDEAGLPIRAATVSPRWLRPGNEVRCNAEGKFEFLSANPPPGASLWIRADGYAAAWPIIRSELGPTSGDGRPIDGDLGTFVLVGDASLVVRVTDSATGLAVPSARVEAIPDLRGERIRGEGFVDEDGSKSEASQRREAWAACGLDGDARLVGLRRGRSYLVRVFAPGYATAVNPVRVDESHDLLIQLARGSCLVLEPAFSPEACEPVWVSVRPTDMRSSRTPSRRMESGWPQRIGPGGVAVFDGLRQGEYTIRVYGGSWARRSEVVSVPTGVSHRRLVVEQGYDLEGVVIASDRDGELGQVSVRVEADGQVWDVPTDDEGRFRFTGLPCPAERCRVRAYAFVPATRSFVVSDWRSGADLDGGHHMVIALGEAD